MLLHPLTVALELDVSSDVDEYTLYRSIKHLLLTHPDAKTELDPGVIRVGWVGRSVAQSQGEPYEYTPV